MPIVINFIYIDPNTEYGVAAVNDTQVVRGHLGAGRNIRFRVRVMVKKVDSGI